MLGNVRVVEIGRAISVAYAGKLFRQFGAEVSRVGAGEADGAFGAWLDEGKSILADAGETRDALSRASVVLAFADGAGDNAGRFEEEQLRKDNPAAVIVRASWFGETGPYGGYAASDAVCRSLAGLVQPVGPREGPPLFRSGQDASIVGGLTIFSAALAQIWGDGNATIDMSLFEANVALTEYQAILSKWRKEAFARTGINRFDPNFPMGIYATAEGWIGITAITPQQWAAFCGMIGRSDLVHDSRFTSRELRMANADALEAIFAPQLRLKTAQEWFEIGLKQRIPLAVVPSVADLPRQEIHRERGAFRRIDIGGREVVAPAPRFGVEPSSRRVAPVPRDPAARGLADGPLAGLRIVDLTMGWAGPLVTRQLADLGAEIVKVESCSYPDWWRGVGLSAAMIAEKEYEKSPFFQIMNRNKKGVTIDLTTPRGREMLLRLVSRSHAVIDNYSAGVMSKLGLGYDDLASANPGIVMLSMPAWGSQGAWADARAYGTTLEQASGLPTLTGRDRDVPVMCHSAYGDPVSGITGAGILLAALIDQKRNGASRRIDLSQVECLLPFTAPEMIEYGLTGAVPPRLGNRRPDMAPHGCYRCEGVDQWVAVAVADAAQFRALCLLLGRDDWAGSAALNSLPGRRAMEDEIDEAISQWAARLSPGEAMRLLQGAGVPAGVVSAPLDIFDDPHLDATGFWQPSERPFVGSHLQPSLPYRIDGKRMLHRAPSPLLGEYNRLVFRDVLGMEECEIEKLAEQGIIGEAMTMPAA